MSTIQELPLSFVRSHHLIRSINSGYVDHLAKTVERIGVKAFPLACTPDGILFGGNHRFNAFSKLGIKTCWMHVYQPASIDREALELNEATEDVLPMSFVDHAELVWRKLEAGQTQQAVADELGWSRDKVMKFALLQKISPEAWAVIVTTFQPVVTIDNEGVVTKIVTTVTFTENLLRDIIPLTPTQQLELVQGLAGEKIQKGKFKTLAQNYRARNEASEWVRQQLVDIQLADRCVFEVAKGIGCSSFRSRV